MNEEQLDGQQPIKDNVGFDNETNKKLIEAGVSPEKYRSMLYMLDKQENPYGTSKFGREYDLESRLEYDPGWLSDFGSSFYNALVVEGGRGLANFAPTVANVFSGKDGHEWANSWIDSVNDWFDAREAIYSDKADEKLDILEGEVNMRHLATGLGQGLGFIAGIVGGGIGSAKIASKLLSASTKAMAKKATGKAARAGLEIGKKGLTKELAKKAGITSKELNALNEAVHYSKWGNRLGSFMTGTTLSFPGYYKTAMEAGLKPGDAAKVALGTAGIVSMTEGAALEWIGKSISNPIVQKASSASLRKAIRTTAGKKGINPNTFILKEVAKDVPSWFRSLSTPTLEGAAIEFGQEFSQTYIEKGIENMYDNVVAGPMRGATEKGKGMYGTDVASKETFSEALWSGIIGGMLGGVMGAGGRAKKILQDGSLEQEATFGYIKRSVLNDKPQNIAKVKDQVEALKIKGELTEEQAKDVLFKIDELVAYSKKHGNNGVTNSVGNYQIYSLDKTATDATTKYNTWAKEQENIVSQNPSIAEETNKDVRDKLSKTTLLSQELFAKPYQHVVVKDEALTEEKEVFEDYLNRSLALEELVLNGTVKEEEDLNKRIREIQSLIFEDEFLLQEKTKDNKKEKEESKEPAVEEEKSKEPVVEEGTKEPIAEPQEEEEKSKKRNPQELSDEELWNEIQSIQKAKEKLGETPDVFALYNQLDDLKYLDELEAEFQNRESEEAKKFAKDIKKKKQSNREELLAKQRENRRKRKNKPNEEVITYSEDLVVNDANNTAEYQGKKYQIFTDEKGSVNSLVDENGNIIVDEDVLVQVEILRDREDLPSIDQKTKDVKDKINNLASFENEGLLLSDALDSILGKNLTPDIIDILNDGISEETTLEQLYALDLYIEDVLSNLNSLPNKFKTEKTGRLHDAIIDLQIQLNEKYERQRQKEVGKVKVTKTGTISNEQGGQTETRKQTEEREGLREKDRQAIFWNNRIDKTIKELSNEREALRDNRKYKNKSSKLKADIKALTDLINIKHKNPNAIIEPKLTYEDEIYKLKERREIGKYMVGVDELGDLKVIGKSITKPSKKEQEKAKKTYTQQAARRIIQGLSDEQLNDAQKVIKEYYEERDSLSAEEQIETIEDRIYERLGNKKITIANQKGEMQDIKSVFLTKEDIDNKNNIYGFDQILEEEDLSEFGIDSQEGMEAVKDFIRQYPKKADYQNELKQRGVAQTPLEFESKYGLSLTEDTALMLQTEVEKELNAREQELKKEVEDKEIEQKAKKEEKEVKKKEKKPKAKEEVTDDVETQKADIEKRRQEELNNKLTSLKSKLKSITGNTAMDNLEKGDINKEIKSIEAELNSAAPVEIPNSLKGLVVTTPIHGKEQTIFTTYFLDRTVVFVNIDGKRYGFYQSTNGTDGKIKDHWYPFYGKANGWVVKDGGGKNWKYNSEASPELQSKLEEAANKLNAEYGNTQFKNPPYIHDASEAETNTLIGSHITNANQDLKNSNKEEYRKVKKKTAEEGFKQPADAELAELEKGQSNIEAKEKVKEEPTGVELAEEAGIKVEEVQEKTEEEKKAEKKKSIEDKSDEIDDFINNQNEGKLQLAKFGVDVNPTETIASNPELYNKIKKNLLKIFPFITVEELDRVVDQVGVDALGRIVEKVIKIKKDEARQDTILHEFGHVLVAMLGKNHPLIKAGFNIIENTDYFKQAQEQYPNLSKEEQLEEALVQAIGERALEKYRTKFNGNLFEKFVQWLKSFWNKFKLYTTKDKAKYAKEVLSDALVYGTTIPSDIDFNVFRNIDKLQKFKSLKSPLKKKAYTGLFNSILFAGENNTELTKDIVMDQMLRQVVDYIQLIKNGRVNDKYFDKFSLFKDERWATEEGIKDRVFKKEVVDALKNELEEKFPKLNEFINSYLDNNSFLNIKENTQDEISDVQIEQEENSKLDDDTRLISPIKGDKQLSMTIRKILGSFIDDNGEPIKLTQVNNYISNLTSKVLYRDEIIDKILQDAQSKNANIVARRLAGILTNDGISQSIKNSILYSIDSISQIEQYKLYTEKTVIDGESVTVIKKKNLNNDQDTLGPVGNQMLYDAKTFAKNNPQAYRDLIQGLEKYALALYQGQNTSIEPALKFIEEVFGNSLYNNQNLQFKYWNYNEKKELIKKLEDSYKNRQDWVRQIVLRPGWDGISLNDYLLQTKKVNNKSIVEADIYKNIKSLAKVMANENALMNTYINAMGNMVSTTSLGSSIDEKERRLKNDKEYRQALEAGVYSDNHVVKQFLTKKSLDYKVIDAVDNSQLDKGAVSEYINLNAMDQMVQQVLLYTQSGSVYEQVIGIVGDRTYLPTVTLNKLEGQELLKEYNNRANHLQKVLNQEIKGMELSKEDRQFIKQQFEDMYFYDLEIDNNQLVVKPKEIFKDGSFVINDNIKQIHEHISKANLTSLVNTNIVRDDYSSVGRSLGLIAEAYYNDALSRMAISDYFQGHNVYRIFAQDNDGKKILNKKSSSDDSLKRYTQSTTGRGRVELKNKKVFTLVIDTNGLSDAQSFNAPKFYEAVRNEVGAVDAVGPLMKDLVYQTNPFSGRLTMYKMATINITENIDGSTSLKEMDNNAYEPIGQAITKFEKLLGDDAVLKVVDKGGSKGTNKYKILNVNDLIDAMRNDNQSGSNINMSKLLDYAIQEQYESYGILYNLHKNPSKTPVHEQSITFASQLPIQHLNNQSTEDISKYELEMVDMLKDQFGLSDKGWSTGQYNFSKTFGRVSDFNGLIEDIINNEQERGRGANNTIEQLKAILEHNKQNPKNQIKIIDDPSIMDKLQQIINSKLHKKAVSLKLPGLHLVQNPDLDSNEETRLKWISKDKNYADVALPWSMFGKTKNEAEALLKKANEEGDGLRVIVVRVPMSIKTMSFPAKVTRFINGDMNSAIVPKEFITLSSSDHDGDQLFVYREEINEKGNIIEPAEITKKEKGVDVKGSRKTKFFNTMWNIQTSEQFLDGMWGDNQISVEPDELNPILDMAGLNTEASRNKLNDMYNSNQAGSKIKTGGKYVGIYANNGRFLSMLAQSGITTLQPLEFSYKGKNYTLSEFTYQNLVLNAVALQAALDGVKDPILPKLNIPLEFSSIDNLLMNLMPTSSGIKPDVWKSIIASYLNDPRLNGIQDGKLGLAQYIQEKKGAFTTEYLDKMENVIEQFSKDYNNISNKYQLSNRNELIKRFPKLILPGKTFSELHGVKEVILGDQSFKYSVRYDGTNNAFELYNEKELSVEEATKIKENIDFFEQFKKLSMYASSLNKWLPTLKMSTSLPKNHIELDNMIKTFADLKGSELFDFNDLYARNLMTHYRNVAKAVAWAYDNVIKSRELLTRTIKDEDGNKKTVEGIEMINDRNLSDKIDDLFDRYISQKQTFFKRDANFTTDFTNKILAWKEFSEMETPQFKEFFANGIYDRYVNVEFDKNKIDSIIEAEYSDPVYKAAVEEFKTFVETSSDIPNVLLNNNFLKILKKGGKDNPTLSAINRVQISSTMKNAAIEDFAKIIEEEPTLAMEFIDYQLIKYGTRDTIGSLIDYMPKGISLNNMLAKQKIDLTKQSTRDYLKDSLALMNTSAIKTFDIRNLKNPDISNGVATIKSEALENLENTEYIKFVTTEQGVVTESIFKRNEQYPNVYNKLKDNVKKDINNIFIFETGKDNDTAMENGKTMEEINKEKAEELKKKCKL